jgi:hypothetical protein
MKTSQMKPFYYLLNCFLKDSVSFEIEMIRKDTDLPQWWIKGRRRSSLILGLRQGSQGYGNTEVDTNTIIYRIQGPDYPTRAEQEAWTITVAGVAARRIRENGHWPRLDAITTTVGENYFRRAIKDLRRKLKGCEPQSCPVHVHPVKCENEHKCRPERVFVFVFVFRSCGAPTADLDEDDSDET